MRITVFGANGKVGSLVVINLLDKGYAVTAFVHGNSRLQPHSKLRIVTGDIKDSAIVYKAISASDGVISTLGSWGTPNKDILTSGMRSIIPAMEKLNIKRIVSLTGADARYHKDAISIVHRFSHCILQILAGKVLSDGENHLELLARSNLDWTVLRSPIMNEKGTSKYLLQVQRPLPWVTINRQAVANALVDQLESQKYIRQSPYVVR